ncbi:UNVERIFIED_CONTAM: hypothetical protein HDU68_005207 [Siphonaria sp. JEL0065]|nr:hypothetical protein HDU68_005207 [Siphonaria sp. JEL0065]
MATEPSTNDDSIHVIDFLDEYIKQCEIKKLKVIESLKNDLQESVDSGFHKQLDSKVPQVEWNNQNLRTNRIEDMGAYVIFRALNNNSFLSAIDLSYNEIGDKGASSIAEFIKGDNRVKRFVLKSNNIGEVGGTAIGKALLVNDTIDEFDMSYNPIGNAGGMEFAATLQVNTLIHKLLLSHCALSTDAMIALSTVLSTTRTVKTLCLSNNESNFSRLTQSCANDIIMHLCSMIKVNRGIEKFGLAKMGISDYMVGEYLAPAVLANRKIAILDLSW